MIFWFEKHKKISFAITIIIGVIIFYISSLQFEPGSAEKDIKPLIYHFFSFFFLALFLAFSLIKGKKKELISIVVVISILYAIFDEIHQHFVPTRAMSLSDILVDSFGIMTATLIYFITLIYREKN